MPFMTEFNSIAYLLGQILSSVFQFRVVETLILEYRKNFQFQRLAMVLDCIAILPSSYRIVLERVFVVLAVNVDTSLKWRPADLSS